MALDIGEILVRFRADSSLATREFVKFHRNLDKSIAMARSQVQSLNRSLNGIGLTAGAGLGAAILKIGADYDRAITNVRAITKETEEQFEVTRRRVLEIASSYGRAAREVGDAMAQIVGAGFEGAESFDTLEASTRLAKAGLVSVDAATNVLIGTLNSFQIKGSQAQDVAGKLLSTVDIGIVTFEQLANRLGLVSPVAASANVRLEEMLGILALLTRNGVNFSQAVTQTRSAILKLVAPGQAAREEMESLLGTTIETSIAQRGFIGTLEAVVQASDGTVASFRRLFEDTEAIQGVTALASAGFDTLRKDIAAIEGAGAGTLSQTLAIQSASFADLAAQLKNLVQNRVVAFFEDNREAIVSTTQAIIDFLNEHEQLVDAIVLATASITGLAATGLALKAALTGLDVIFSGINAGLGLLIKNRAMDTATTAGNTAAHAANTASAKAGAAAWTYHAAATAASAKATTGNTAATAGSTAATVTNTQATVANNVANAQYLALQTKAIVLRNASTAAITANTIAHSANTAAATSAASVGRIYVENIAATTAAQSASIATTAAATARFAALRAVLGKTFPTFAKFPSLFRAAIPVVTGFGVAIAAVAAKLALLGAAAYGAYKAGVALSDFFTGNSNAARQQVKELTELNEVMDRVSQRTMLNLGRENPEREKAAQTAAKVRDTLNALADAQDRASRGSAKAAAEVMELERQLAALGESSDTVFRSATEELKRLEQVVVNALRETGQLGENYLGAFTEAGRLVRGFGQSLAEQSALEITLGEGNAAVVTQRIAELKDQLTGVAAAQQRYEESARRAATATGLLGNAIASATNFGEKYGGTFEGLQKRISELAKRAGDLTSGEFAQGFKGVLDLLIETEEIIEDLTSRIETLQANTRNMAIMGADPAQLESAVEKIGDLEAQLTIATEAANRFGIALANMVDEQNTDIAAKRIAAIEEVKQAEIRALQESGREREAQEMAAAIRRDQAIRRIQEALEDEKRRRQEINELLKTASLTNEERAALQLTLERSEALSELYKEQIKGIDAAYGRELAAIHRNAAEQERRLEEERQRRAIIALEQEKADQARIALQARMDGDAAKELAARQKIAEIELQILGIKGLQAEKELDLIRSHEERLSLLRAELESIRRLGGSNEDQLDAIREAQRDIGGTSEVRNARENIRRRMEDVQTEEGAESQRDAFRESVREEERVLEHQYREAQREGDEEEMRRLVDRKKQLDEIQRIYDQEHERRLKQIAEERKAREEAEKQRQAEQQQQSQDQQPAQSPQQPAQALQPGQSVQDPTDPAQSPQTPSTGPTRPDTKAPGVPDASPGTTTTDPVTKVVLEQTSETTKQITEATAVLTQAAEGVRLAIASLGESVTTALGTVTGKLSEVVTQTNANTRAIAAIQNEARALRIEGRS